MLPAWENDALKPAMTKTINLFILKTLLNNPSTSLRVHFSLIERWSLSAVEVSRNQQEMLN